MQVQSMHFKQRAGVKLADVRLQKNLKKLADKFVTARASAVAELEDFEGTRTAAVERRNRVLANLDGWLQTFETQCCGARRYCVVRREPPRGGAADRRDRQDARRAQSDEVEVNGLGGN